MDKASVSVAWLVAGGILGSLVLVGGLLYVVDYGVEATIVAKSCPDVTVETHVGGIEVTQRVRQSQCTAVQRGDVVVYHIRTGDLEYHPKGGGLF